MATIAFMSPKGGVGKTTSALLLACEFAESGQKVTLIDADPNRPAVRWAQLPGCPKTLTVVSHDGARGEDTIGDEIDRAARQSKVVVVDLEGTANLAMAFAIARADLVIIPCQGTQLDAHQAFKAANLVRQQEKVVRHKIPHWVVLTRTSAAIRDRGLRDLKAEIEAAGVKIMAVEIMQRAAFAMVFRYGGCLSGLKDDEVGGVAGARVNLRAYANEVLAILSGAHEETSDATVIERRPAIHAPR